MRTWSLPDGGRLLEWERDESHHADSREPLFDPAAGQTHETYRYYLVPDAGRVRDFRSGVSSVEFDLYRWGHAVVADQLLKFQSTHDTEHDTAEYEVRVELDWLQPEAGDPEATARACAAVERHRRQLSEGRAEDERRIGAVMASFRAALLARRDGDRSPLVLDHGKDAPYPWIVRTPDGTVVWQTTGWRYYGEDLYRDIGKIARELGCELEPNRELYASPSWTCD